MTAAFQVKAESAGPVGSTVMKSLPYRIVEHPADTGFEVWGDSLARLFEAAAMAFFDIMWRLGPSRKGPPRTIEVTAGDREELLVNFLEEFHYLYDAEGLVCTRVEILTITERKVTARVWLRDFNDAQDLELLSVKAVTYHQLFIGKKNSTWEGRVFLDI
jgi:SHS2 domain-containing protein